MHKFLLPLVALAHLLALGVDGSLAQAEVLGNLTVEIQMTTNTANFKWDSNLKVYKATDLEVQMQGRMDGSGLFYKRNARFSNIIRSVPGIDVTGHSYISLNSDDNVHFVVKEDAELFDPAQGTRSKVNNSLTVDFSKGDISIFKSGGPVELRVSKEGQDHFLNRTINEFVNAFSRGLKDEIAQSGRKIIIESVVQVAELSPLFRYRFESENAAILNFDIHYIVNITAQGQ